MNVCMHLGGPLHHEGDQFVCWWHGAAYGCAHGRRLEGPGRPDARVMFLPTQVEDGILFYGLAGERSHA